MVPNSSLDCSESVCADKVKAYGIVQQSQFLLSLGIGARVKSLIQNAQTEKDKQDLFEGFKRLVEGQQMGSSYKVLSIVPSNQGTPVGFESLEPAPSSPPL